jgi:hypothetical protein
MSRPPLCFLHVPKSAGQSIHFALKAALPDGAIATRHMDESFFCGFSDFERLEEPLRSMVAADDSEVDPLARYRVVSGHFALPTLERLGPARNVATVLREPRSRLLSTYMFLRFTPILDAMGVYGREVLAPPSRALESWLSDPSVARVTDNQACRLVLHDDPRMPDGEFVTTADVDDLAGATLERLGDLGYVGILEFDDVWRDLSRFFGLKLDPLRRNVSGSFDSPDGQPPLPSFDMRVVLDLIDRRTAVDRLVYEAILATRCGGADEALRIADAAFAEQLVRLGAVMERA